MDIGLRTAHRFAVALSFPGEHRDFIEQVAGQLAEKFGKEHILYDHYHDAEFARPDLNIYLPSLYRKDSELIVIFLCPEYPAKHWCRLEWRHVAQLIATVDAERIMFFSFGNPGDLSELGILPGDGYIDIQQRQLTSHSVTENILKRRQINQRPRDITCDTQPESPHSRAHGRDSLQGLGKEGARLQEQKLGAHLPTDLRARFHRNSRDLLSWPTTLPGDHWLERPELAVLLQRIEDEPHSVTLLLGEPGCGKSALLARLGQVLEQRTIAVLGIKADYLPESLHSSADLAEYLGLPDTLACIQALAKEGTVVILFDQLDALADLVVQHSARLRAPLELIRDLAEREGIHVVASCRPFEHSHDPRLRHLSAEPMLLALPSWKQVDAVLQAKSIHAGRWNADLHEVLRSPHALDLFLRILQTTDEAHLLRSFQGVLEELWKRDVLSDTSGRRRTLLLDIAQRMAERETLWLPLANFENRYPVIQELAAAGMLINDEGEGRLGFRHQTLYEFVRARTFLETAGSLTETLLARQDSLRVRPQFWHALKYFRDTDRIGYLDEIGRLWMANLRPHLRMLLIEFLGLQQDPTAEEARLFYQRFDDPWHQTRIIAAVAGSPGWFERLAPSHLPLLMAKPVEKCWPVAHLLVQALPFAQPAVLALLDAHWLPHIGRDSLCWRILENASQWNVALVDRLCCIIERTDVDAWRINSLASIISLPLPEQAPRLVAAWLLREWQRDLPLEAEAEDDSVLSGSYNSPVAKRCRTLFKNNSLHDIPAIAEAAPQAFLDAVWPWFVQVLESITEGPHPFVIGYSQNHIFFDSLDDDPELRLERAFLSALQLAVERLAEQQTDAFLKFAEANANLDHLLVQRLLAKGMARIVQNYPAAVLEFLCCDPRRLVLGPSSNCHKNSQDLIRTLAPHLDGVQFLRLEQTVLAWNRYYGHQPDDDADTRLRRLRWNREHRLRLLNMLPRERMSDACRRLVKEEERAFPELRDYDISFSDAHGVGSPVSAQQMQAAQDEDILNLFGELTDDHGWDHPRRRQDGGPIQAGRELAKLAKEDPARVVNLVRRLRPGVNEIPVGDVLPALASAGYDRSALYALIEELADKGFTSAHFRHYAAQAVRESVSNDHPLPESLFERLESWLAPAAIDDEDKPESPGDEKEMSLLWGYGGSYILPAGNYSILTALSAACLHPKPPRTDRWLDILERHLQRTESSQVWSALCHYLPWLHLAEQQRAQAFLNRLFHAYPAVMATLQGIRLLAKCQHWIEPKLAMGWLDFMAREAGNTGAQGCGELMALRHALFPAEIEAAERIDNTIGSDDTEGTTHHIRIGIAYSVAHLWSDKPDYRQQVHGYLLRLLRHSDADVHKALATVFLATQGFAPDQATGELLDALADHPAILQHQQAEYLVEHLENLLDMEPERVCTVCNALLDQAGGKIADTATSWFLRGDSIATIALALQDMGGSHKTSGTALFERLLEFNVPNAREILTELDKRTANRSAALTPRRRNRALVHK